MSDNPQRSIDAPAPPWRLAGNLETEEQKTAKAAEAAAATEKAELAKRLVEEAKAKVEAKKAADAKKKKAELAAQLVAEAKKKQAAKPKKAAPKAKKAPAKAKKKSLADRTSRPGGMSAKDALAAALAAEAEKEAKKATTKTKSRRKAKPKAKAKATPKAAAPAPAKPAAPAPAPAPPAPEPAVEAADPTVVIQTALPNTTIQGELLPVTNTAVFSALWKANRTRAVHTGDLPGIATANVLLDAVARVNLVAAKVAHDGTYWAVWVDTNNGAIIAAAKPADIYLAGL